MATRTYDPGSVIVVFGANVLTGFSESTMVRVERDEDTYTKKSGVDGEITRSRNRNRAGSVVVTLMQTSASNLVLSNHLNADELAPNGIPPVPVVVKDNAGNSLHTAKDAWIKKTPASEYAKEAGDREWTIDTGPMLNKEGGN